MRNKSFSLKRKIIAICLVIIMLASVIMPITARAATDDRLGTVLWSNIVGYVNGVKIPTYNIDGFLYIQASDLRGYGFRVDWDEIGRRAIVSYQDGKVTSPLTLKANEGINNAGKSAYGYYKTDIRSYVADAQVQTYNIDGHMLIPFNSLGAYGTCVYNDLKREATLVTAGTRSTPAESNTVGGAIHYSNEKFSIDGYQIPVYSMITKTKVAQETVSSALQEAQTILSMFNGQPDNYVYTAPNGISYDRIAAQDLVNSLGGGGASEDNYVESTQNVVMLDDLKGYGISVSKSGENYLLSVVNVVTNPINPKANAEQFYASYHLPGVKAIVDSIPATVYKMSNGKYVIPIDDLAALGSFNYNSGAGGETQGIPQSALVSNLQLHFNVSGVITSTDDKSAPIADATIKLINQFNSVVKTVNTNAKGEYKIKDIVTGVYSVRAYLDDAETYSDLFLLQGKDLEIDLEMEAIKAGLSVIVQARDGSNVAGATVTLTGVASGSPLTGKTNSNGLIEWEDILAGHYNLKVESSDFVTNEMSLKLSGVRTTQNVTLVKSGYIVSGVVRNLGWNYYGNFTATLVPLAKTGANVAGQTQGASVSSNVRADGTFMIEGVTSGWYRLEISGVGFESYVIPSLSINFDTVGLVCTMKLPTNLVSGTVTLPDGTPVANARVDVRRNSPTGDVVKTVYTDSQGYYSFDAGIVDGDYYVQITYGSDVHINEKPSTVSNGSLTKGGDVRNVIASGTSTLRINTVIPDGLMRQSLIYIKAKLEGGNATEIRDVDPVYLWFDWSNIAAGTYTLTMYYGIAYGESLKRVADVEAEAKVVVVDTGGLILVEGFVVKKKDYSANISVNLDYKPITDGIVYMTDMNTKERTQHLIKSGKVTIPNLVNGTEYKFELEYTDSVTLGNEPILQSVFFSDVAVNWNLFTANTVNASGLIENLPEDAVTSVTLKLTGAQYLTVPLVKPYESFTINGLTAGNYEIQASAVVSGATIVSQRVAFAVKEGQNAVIPPLVFASTYEIKVSAVLDDKPLNGGTVKVIPLTGAGGNPNGTPWIVPIASGEATVSIANNGWYRLELHGLNVEVTGNSPVEVEINYNNKSQLWYLYTTQEQSMNGVINGVELNPTDVVTRFTVAATGSGTIVRVPVEAPYDTFDLGKVNPGTYTVQATMIVNGKTVMSDAQTVTVTAGKSLMAIPLEFDLRYSLTASFYADSTPVAKQVQVMIQRLVPDEAGGTVIDTTFERSNHVYFTTAGSYTFVGLPNGKYRVYVNPSATDIFLSTPPDLTIDINYSNVSYVWNVKLAPAT